MASSSSSSSSMTMFVFLLLLQLLAIVPLSSSQSIQTRFYNCVQARYITPVPFSDEFSAPENSSFTTVFESTAQNLRCLLPPVHRPVLIFRPRNESHVQAAVVCAREVGVRLRIRSGGHDYEGISYISTVAAEEFVLMDMSNMRSVSVDIQRRTAWAESGATIGEVYYSISRNTGLFGFPAGVCPTVGFGGHISGGAHGFLLRKYGLGVDNVVDARIVDSHGRILDRAAMGEDVFWAIRGGGGGSYGIVLSWKLNLVPVPRTVTVFNVARTLEQGAVRILNKWQQIADKIDNSLLVRVVAQPASSGNGRTVTTLYQALFLGGADQLLNVMNRTFPELGLTRTDTTEMSWIQSVLYHANFPANSPPENLLRPSSKSYFKAKSDYLTNPVPENVIEPMLRNLLNDDFAMYIFTPYGGQMSRISDAATPYPHRKGVIGEIQYLSFWQDNNPDSATRHTNWIRGAYQFMTPYVSSSPRGAYVNYRDLDLGVNGNNGSGSFGVSYFKNNFRRLVDVKRKFDPDNFFRHEQSIPI